MHMMQTKAQFLQAPWAAPTNIHTLITTNIDDFNLATHVGDDETKVLANREKLSRLLPGHPIWLNQTHGINVINADECSQADLPPDADAAISFNSKVVCVVMTADCLPILLTNRGGEFVAAIHAGWRGLNDGIIANTLAKLSQFEKKDILAFIGPAIGQECFEISSEVRENFLANDIETKQYFIPSANPGKFMANLRLIAAHQMVKLGLNPKNISNNNICTKCNNEWFYSYRANPQTGRFATLIWKD